MVIMATHILGKDELTVQSCLEALIRSKMYSLLCDKHKRENNINHSLVTRLPGEGWFQWSMRVKPLKNENCPSCSIIGLSKSGRIEELDSLNDWMFT